MRSGAAQRQTLPRANALALSYLVSPVATNRRHRRTAAVASAGRLPAPCRIPPAAGAWLRRGPGQGGSAEGRAAAVLDPELLPVALPRALLIEAFAHARECYPEECCGLLIGRPGQPPSRIVRCANVQSLRRSRGETELDAREAFWMDERDLDRAVREAERRDEEIQVVYHSHIDADAYLSQHDLAGALGPNGRPLWPRAAQLVLSVRDGTTREAVCFVWSDADQSYRGHALQHGAACAPAAESRE
jgi:proteasome lid subunit RPN8/RPN11